MSAQTDVGERPNVRGVTGPGTNVRESSGAPGIDTAALSSLYSNDSADTQRSGQGEVLSRSPGSNSAVTASGSYCRSFSARFSPT